MGIQRYLKGKAFDSETVTAMSVALTKVLQQFGLSDNLDPAVEMLALLVIEQAQTGERDADRIAAAVLDRCIPRH